MNYNIHTSHNSQFVSLESLGLRSMWGVAIYQFVENTLHNNIILQIVLLLLLSLSMNGVCAEKSAPEFIVEVASSDWIPYVYEDKGVIKGSAYKIAKDVLDRAGVQFNYRILPWARVYRNGLDKENYLIGGLGRTPKREKKFHWIGPVTVGTDIFFYKIKSNPGKINSVEGAKNYRIGA